LSAANTYGGLTTIRKGRVIADNPQALGGTDNGTIVDAGAALLVQADVNGEPLFLNGDGVASAGALESTTRFNIYSGPITLQTNSPIGVDAGSQLTITNSNPSTDAITDGSNTFNLTKVGGGTLTLAHSTAYHGSTVVKKGILQLRDPLALASSSDTQ